MLLLGLLLILVAAAVLVLALLGGTGDQATILNGHSHVATLAVFLAGAVTLLLFMLGLDVSRSGLSRFRQLRRDQRRLRKLEKREADRAAVATPAPNENTDSEGGDKP
jgi:hypothetical protein